MDIRNELEEIPIDEIEKVLYIIHETTKKQLQTQDPYILQGFRDWVKGWKIARAFYYPSDGFGTIPNYGTFEHSAYVVRDNGDPQTQRKLLHAKGVYTVFKNYSYGRCDLQLWKLALPQSSSPACFHVSYEVYDKIFEVRLWSPKTGLLHWQTPLEEVEGN